MGRFFRQGSNHLWQQWPGAWAGREPGLGGSLGCPGHVKTRLAPGGGADGSFALPGTRRWRVVGAPTPKTEALGPVMTALQGLSRGAGWLGLWQLAQMGPGQSVIQVLWISLSCLKNKCVMSVVLTSSKKKKKKNTLKFFFNKKELYPYSKFVSQIKREALSCPSELLCGVYPRRMCVKLASLDKRETPRASHSQLSLLGLPGRFGDAPCQQSWQSSACV